MGFYTNKDNTEITVFWVMPIEYAHYHPKQYVCHFSWFLWHTFNVESHFSWKPGFCQVKSESCVNLTRIFFTFWTDQQQFELKKYNVESSSNAFSVFVNSKGRCTNHYSDLYNFAFTQNVAYRYTRAWQLIRMIKFGFCRSSKHSNRRKAIDVQKDMGFSSFLKHW